MIHIDETNKVFHLQTKHTSYIFRVLDSNHLATVYFGALLNESKEIANLEAKHEIEIGNQVVYDEKDKTFNLNLAYLEMPTFGKGDYREPALHIRYSDGSRTSDFHYLKHQVIKKPDIQELPETKAYHESIETLVVTLKDAARDIELDLHYSVFPEVDVITRRMIVRNNSKESITIEKAMSMNFDTFSDEYLLSTFDGAWIRERMIHKQSVVQGIIKIDSKKGVSSSDHNPFIVLSKNETSEQFGKCYGFGLIYSGNFEAVIERSPHDMIRVHMGINSFDFYWELNSLESFTTPEVVMSFSNTGFNRLSQNYHELIKNNIIKPDWQGKERPVLFNNWEGTYFDFTQRKLLNLAKKAKSLGIELFVLDDGWFGKRNSDSEGLGDWYVNKKKLPLGIDGLAKKINKIGLDFGIWVEPEMVNPNSDLYRLHPDWAIKHPKYKASFGRNQLILDLTKEDVREYIKTSMSNLIESANITYVKWDMNRNFSDIYSTGQHAINQGKLMHLYYLGLYEILEDLTTKYPHVLFESCASGGNRFDMGMMMYMPQTWTSDNTDAHTRQLIHYGTTFCYPQSTMGAHVSESPSSMSIRKTDIETRFDVNCFSLLGYESDITKITKFEKVAIKNQIEFYKKHRKLLQFGDYYRIKNPFETNNAYIAVTNKDKTEAILGVFQTLEKPAEGLESINMYMLDKQLDYHITSRLSYFNLGKFSYLLKHVMPFNMNHNGLIFHMIKNRYMYQKESEDKVISGDKLVHNGFVPKQSYMGTGLNDNVRLMGDFGSRLYYFKALEE